jgi:hypothetical protein
MGGARNRDCGRRHRPRAAPRQPARAPQTTFTDAFAPIFTAKCKQTVTRQGHGSIVDTVCYCALGWIVSHYPDAQIKAFVEAHDCNPTAAAIKACVSAP